MDKYQNNNNDDTVNRSNKHSYLYKEIYGNIGSNFDDLPVPTNTNEIDITRLKKIALNRDDYKKIKDLSSISAVREEEVVEDVPTRNETKIHDINELLKKAKEENSKLKEVQKKRINTNYEFLRIIDKEQNEIDRITEKNDAVSMKPKIEETREMKYHTKKISLDPDVEKVLAKTASLSLDILSDLKPSGNTSTVITPPLREKTEEILKEPEIVKTNNRSEDKTFYSNSYTFSRKDFDAEDEIDNNKVSKNVIAFRIIIILITFAIIVGIFLYILNYLEVFTLI